jgi:hypothetical protein
MQIYETLDDTDADVIKIELPLYLMELLEVFTYYTPETLVC